MRLFDGLLIRRVREDEAGITERLIKNRDDGADLFFRALGDEALAGRRALSRVAGLDPGQLAA